MTSVARAQRRRAARAKGRNFPVVGWVMLAMVGLLAAAIVLTSGGEQGASVSDSSLQEAAPVEITGQPLPELSDPADDPAVGMKAPEVRGEDFSGRQVNVLHDGIPKMLVFMAHWCSHCQAEVPVIQDWLNAGGAPHGVELITVSTLASKDQPNYPPSAWLDREGWTMRTMVDSTDSAVQDAFGLPGTPYFVFMDGDGVVTARVSGEVPIADLEALLAPLKEGVH